MCRITLTHFLFLPVNVAISHNSQAGSYCTDAAVHYHVDAVYYHDAVVLYCVGSI